MKPTLIQNALLVNEGKIQPMSLLISEEGRIAKMAPVFQQEEYPEATVIDATGLFLLPGIIDTHVHFRDPGLTEKADFHSESCAAVAGGVTSVIEMPNTNPQTTTLEALREKKAIAAEKSLVNYGFMVGATNQNIPELALSNSREFAAIKLFMGSSTGNMLVDEDDQLDFLFRNAKKLIVAHCEEESIVKANNEQFKAQYQGTEQETASLHPQIRSAEACYQSTKKAVELAKKYNARFHVAHITTARELQLLEGDNITAEVTPNHLYFCDEDYDLLGNFIKCNPAIKSDGDRKALWQALEEGKIATIATDHAPHTLEQKLQPYFSAPSGIPSIQHSLPMVLEPLFWDQNNAQDLLRGLLHLLPTVVEKMSHAPARLFSIRDRGYVREGYFADLTLLRVVEGESVKKEDLLYKCGWSPVEGHVFHTRVEKTFVNGALVYDNKKVNTLQRAAMPLEYNN